MGKNNDLGKNIRGRLLDLGKSQLDLAQYCGISKQTLSDIIRGVKAPSLRITVKISEFLGVGVDDLLAPAKPYYKGGRRA